VRVAGDSTRKPFAGRFWMLEARCWRLETDQAGIRNSKCETRTGERREIPRLASLARVRFRDSGGIHRTPETGDCDPRRIANLRLERVAAVCLQRLRLDSNNHNLRLGSHPFCRGRMPQDGGCKRLVACPGAPVRVARPGRAAAPPSSCRLRVQFFTRLSYATGQVMQAWNAVDFCGQS
jgi:hypothetical protein